MHKNKKKISKKSWNKNKKQNKKNRAKSILQIAIAIKNYSNNNKKRIQNKMRGRLLL